MHAPRGRSAYARLLCAAAILLSGSPAMAAGSTVKVAFWNVKSGKGQIALPGHPALFADTTNCTSNTAPLNAWGVGQMQAELIKTLSDPTVVALGVAEAWLCATPDNIRTVLGWKAATSNQNGVALVARYGFAGSEQWQQLDTSLNVSPNDTMWVLRIPVCLDAYCLQSMPVYVTHWLSTSVNPITEYDIQAQQTVQFLQGTSGGLPHVLVGDLNIFEGTSVVCTQSPDNSSLNYLRSAGYLDAWNLLRSGQDGTTGMLNRAGCGTPEGATWKRIDYVWSTAAVAPVDVQRFGLVTPGDAAPSDHLGIIATLPTTVAAASATPPSPSPAPIPVLSPSDVVLYAGRATTIAGAWAAVADASAAGGVRMSNPDAGAPKLMTPLAAPANYFELPFAAAAGVPYRLWMRGRAQNDSYANDSVYVQFSGSLTAAGTPTFRIGTTSATTVNLEEAANVGVSGWGWQDNGYGLNVLGPALYFDGTPETLRVQVREDGFSIDQIVLSPATFLSASPGTTKNDVVILPPSTGTGGSSSSGVPTTWSQAVNVATTATAVTKNGGCDGCPDAAVLGATALSSGDAFFKFTPTIGGRLIVGLLPDGAPATDFKSMRYSAGFWSDGTWDAREQYVYKGGGVAKPGDLFGIAFVGNEARIYLNGAIVYRSPRATGSYHIAAVFLSKGGTIAVTTQDLVIGTYY